METLKKTFRVNRKDIGYLKFIFEAYDGIAAITTLEPQEGLIQFRIAPGCEAEVDMVIKSLRKHDDLMIERII